MAAVTPRKHNRTQHLPLSPPPSPPSARRRQKKREDPFEILARTPVPSRPASPIDAPADDEESVLKRILLTPVLFVSFILSLFLVNHRNRARRSKAQTSSISIFSYLAPSIWLDPEPYQDPDDTTWSREGSQGHVEPHDAIGPKTDAQSEDGKRKKPWHLNKKIRKVAKLEISDAFEMRGRIIVIMLILIMFGSVTVWMGMKWILASVSRMVFAMFRNQ